ncbi:hypothetical protein [Arthrobacter sp. Br18]|uniref:hypothetical protein n=1 Tax=Arthrobacter sp. Br18 TaxID=1312954 RepID=UPI0020A63E1D|nr:hypothetical protein [Arthrobacter sp. Br18]
MVSFLAQDPHQVPNRLPPGELALGRELGGSLNALHRRGRTHLQGRGQIEAFDQLRQGVEVHLKAVPGIGFGHCVKIWWGSFWKEGLDLLKVLFESCRRDDFEHSCLLIAGIPEGVPLIPRLQYQLTRAGVEHFIPEKEADPTLGDDRVFVLAAVHVKRGSEFTPGQQVFNNGEPSPGGRCVQKGSGGEGIAEPNHCADVFADRSEMCAHEVTIRALISVIHP